MRQSEDLLVKTIMNEVLHGEKLAQRLFVNSDTLPIKMEPSEAKSTLIKAGVKFFGLVKDARLFQRAVLPVGWKKVAACDTRLSMLMDDQGRERARIFYKETYYDRKATLFLTGRYGIRDRSESLEELLNGTGPVVCEITDGGVVSATSGKVLCRVEIVPETNGNRRTNRFKAHQKAGKIAVEWLNARYPEWQNPIAYWD